MLDWRCQRMDVSAHAGTVHDDQPQKRLDEDLWWTILHVPQATKSVKGPTAGTMYALINIYQQLFACREQVWSKPSPLEPTWRRDLLVKGHGDILLSEGSVHSVCRQQVTLSSVVGMVGRHCTPLHQLGSSAGTSLDGSLSIIWCPLMESSTVAMWHRPLRWLGFGWSEWVIWEQCLWSQLWHWQS